MVIVTVVETAGNGAAGEAKMEKLEFIRVEDGLAGLTA